MAPRITNIISPQVNSRAGNSQMRSDVAELLALNPPPDWYETEDPELHNKYYFAQLLKQFGDIPELRYIIVFDLKPKDNITIEQAIAWSEAMYRLFPSTENLRALRFISSLPLDGYLPPQDEPKNEVEAWMRKDPEGFIDFFIHSPSDYYMWKNTETFQRSTLI